MPLAVRALLGASLLVLLTTLLPAAATVAAPSPAPSLGPADASVSRGDCALLGRAYAGGGCSRTACVAGATLFNPNLGAELCATRSGRHPYATTVAEPTCRALGRRWISSANYCATSPVRGVVDGAPQCTGTRTTYVAHDETEGHYDECLAPTQVAELDAAAAAAGTSLATEADRRNPVNCSLRPGQALVDGVCQPDPSPPPGGETVLIGDSLGWRAGDELAARRPDIALDAQPARKIGDLRSRLAFQRALRGEPAGLVLELGTNASPGFSRRTLARAVGSLPAGTRVLFVLPYRATRGAQAPTYAGWMRDLARSRAHTCTADWPGLVARRPGLLLDGVHPTSRGESVYAGLVARAWARCR